MMIMRQEPVMDQKRMEEAMTDHATPAVIPNPFFFLIYGYHGYGQGKEREKQAATVR